MMRWLGGGVGVVLSSLVVVACSGSSAGVDLTGPPGAATDAPGTSPPASSGGSTTPGSSGDSKPDTPPTTSGGPPSTSGSPPSTSGGTPPKTPALVAPSSSLAMATNPWGVYRSWLDATTPVDGTSSQVLTSGPGATLQTYAFTSGSVPIDASRQGKRYRMRVKVKTQLTDAAFVWFRIDSPTGYVLDNMTNPTNRTVLGTTPWREISLVLDVPADATAFSYGSGLYGGGAVWVGAFTFDEVDATLPVTPHTSGAK